jgi:outer membrane protein OmpA-like peptidoglycan-associated protein/tetratricopeptide (TPR) repeat protein
MKIYSQILLFVLFSVVSTAQTKETKEADQLFDRYEYGSAAKAYLALVEKGNTSEYAYKQLAESYFKIEKTTEAEKWYALTVKSSKDAETLYNYIQVLKYNGKYDEANTQMKSFANQFPNDTRAVAFKSNPDYLNILKNKEPLFEVNKINLNAENSSFGAVLYGSTLYFAAAKKEGTKIYGWNEEPFLDLYQSEYNKQDNTYGVPTGISELNSVYHEGPLTMTKDGNTIYFSSESFKDKLFEKDKVKKLKFGQVSLYKAVKDNNVWTAITPLPFNDKSYSTGNPSIDSTGKILYFASNMPGSIGGTDIWKVTVNADGSYGTPENMGPEVNTEADENFPFIADDNTLYFSSNRLLGLGGLDVYAIKQDAPSKAINLGSPINSNKDDFSFSIDSENKAGYISSNRLGKDAIYSTAAICKAQVLTIVKNAKTLDLIAGAKIVVMDTNKNVLETRFSDSEGKYLYKGECTKKYIVAVYKDGYITKEFSLDELQAGVIALDAAVDPIDVVVTETEIVLNPIYFENNKSNITTQGAEELDKLVYIMGQNNDLKIFVKSHTDFRGQDDYNMRLSNHRVDSTIAYIISKGISAERVTGKGFGETEPKVNCGENCTEEEHALNRRSEFMIVK